MYETPLISSTTASCFVLWLMKLAVIAIASLPRNSFFLNPAHTETQAHDAYKLTSSRADNSAVWWGAGAGVVICLERGADLHTARLMPLPLTVSCFSKIEIGFTFLVLAHLGSPGKGPLNGCVCVCVVPTIQQCTTGLAM